MNKMFATAAQLLELAFLMIKRLEGIVGEQEVKKAILDKEHPFWTAFGTACATLIVTVEQMKEVVKTTLRKIREVTTPVLAAKPTSECFQDRKIFWEPDGDIVRWLPENQPESPESSFSVQELTTQLKFKAMAEEILGEKGDEKNLSRSMIRLGNTTTLSAIESLVLRQEGGEDVGLRTDGYANFFFVEDKDGCVSVVYVCRRDGQWFVGVYRLGNGGRWGVGIRVFVRNSGTSGS